MTGRRALALRCTIVLLTILTLTPLRVRAQTPTWGSRIASTSFWGLVSRQWMRHANGHLYSRASWSGWTDHGSFGNGLRPQGVDATSWSGASPEERVYFIAADGKLWQYAMTNLGNPTALAIGDPPSGTTLTGEVGALHDYSGGGEYLDVVAVDSSGNLSDYWSHVGSGTWYRMALGNPGTPIDAFADLAVTTDAAGGMLIFVVRLTNGHLAANINFSWMDLGVPPAGTSGALAATMAKIGGIQKLLVVTPAA